MVGTFFVVDVELVRTTLLAEPGAMVRSDNETSVKE
jgi:hypothetical protein